MTGRLAVSVKEASQITSIGEASIRLAINKGHLPAKRNGRNIVIKTAHLDAWLDSLEDVAS